MMFHYLPLKITSHQTNPSSLLTKKLSKNKPFLLLLVSLMGLLWFFSIGKANAEVYSTLSVTKTHELYACSLKPFMRMYMDVAVLENKAREKVRGRCGTVEGHGSIFCKGDKAQCTKVEVSIKEPAVYR